MITKPALPMLAAALTLSACNSMPKPVPIPVVAETRQCPPFATPPRELMKPPEKVDYLSPND